MFSGMHYVYQVYKARSFSKAAQQLFISQPALSASVKRIEERIGYSIFDRSSKPLSITECGAKYIAAIEEMMAVQKEFTDYLNEWQEAHVGSLTIGGTSLFSSLILHPLIAEFSSRYPKIQLTLVESSTGKLEEQLQKGEIDVLIDNDELDETAVESQLFFQENLLLAVPEHYPINQELTEYDNIRSRSEVVEAPIVPILGLPTSHSVIYYKVGTHDARRNVYAYWKKRRYVSRALTEFLKIIQPVGTV